MTTENAQKFHRGEISPVDPTLVFLRYRQGKEVWVSKDRLEKVKAQHRAVNTKQRAKPEHKEKMKAYFKVYGKSEKNIQYRTEYYKRPEVRERIRNKWANDPDYMREYRKLWKAITANRIAKNCRSRMRDAVVSSGTHKISKTKELLGCSFEFFRGWLESKFKRGMSWQNYGIFWHIDHIKPVSSFDMHDPEQQRACFHYSNCQPLWKDENLSKGSKLNFEPSNLC